jgi:hypothetical protein
MPDFSELVSPWNGAIELFIRGLIDKNSFANDDLCHRVPRFFLSTSKTN